VTYFATNATTVCFACVLPSYHDSRGNVSSQDVRVLENIVLEDMSKIQVNEAALQAALQMFVSRN